MMRVVAAALALLCVGVARLVQPQHISGEMERQQLERFLRLLPDFPTATFRNHTIGCVERHFKVENWEDIAPPRFCIHYTHYFLNQYFVHRHNLSIQAQHGDPVVQSNPQYVSLRQLLNTQHAGLSIASDTVLSNSVSRNCLFKVNATVSATEATTGGAAALHPFFEHLTRLPVQLSLDIWQRSCEHLSAWVEGGASFSVHALSPLLHLDCDWTHWDRAPSHYRHECHIYYDYVTHARYVNGSQRADYAQEELALHRRQLYWRETELCFEYVVLLDYEGYRAYSEVGQPAMGEELLSATLCVEGGARRLAAGTVAADHSHNGAVRHLRTVSTSAPTQALASNAITADSSLSEGLPRRWPSSLVAPSAYGACLVARPLIFVGASHSRYLWDELLLRYFDGKAELLKVPLHHSDEFIEGTDFLYYRNYFLWTLPRTIEGFCAAIERNISSLAASSDGGTSIPAYAQNQFQQQGKGQYQQPQFPGTKKGPGWWTSVNASSLRGRIQPLRVVLQAGAWDHLYFTARAVREHVDPLVDVLQAVAARPCSAFLEITLLSTVPVPLCATHPTLYTTMQPHSKTCAADRGHRNNHALRAVSRELLAKVQALQYPHASITRWAGVGTRLRTVDTFGLKAPFGGQAVCGVHYFCPQRVRVGGRPDIVQLQTPAGILHRNAVLHSLCGLQ